MRGAASGQPKGDEVRRDRAAGRRSGHGFAHEEIPGGKGGRQVCGGDGGLRERKAVKGEDNSAAAAEAELKSRRRVFNSNGRTNARRVGRNFGQVELKSPK